MTNPTTDIRNKLKQYKFKYGLLQKDHCSKEEKKILNQLKKTNGQLPEGIYEDTDVNNYAAGSFYRIHGLDLTESEINEYLAYQQIDLLVTIKNHLIFLSILATISVVPFLIFIYFKFL